MDRTFAETLSVLRRERNLSQRTVAADLGVSQAVLSHYENGVREPSLSFVCRACDYYGVTADYLLCRSDTPDGLASARQAARVFLEQLRAVADRAELALEELSNTEKKEL